jgi:hypothetical protein
MVEVLYVGYFSQANIARWEKQVAKPHLRYWPDQFGDY